MSKTTKEIRLAVVIEALGNQAVGLDYKASRADSATAATWRRRAKGYRDTARYYERKLAKLVLKRTAPTKPAIIKEK